MARTTQQILDGMVAEAVTQATAIGNTDMVNMFANTSKVAAWRLLFYVMAFAIMTFEKLMDAFKLSVDNVIASQKPHTTKWYELKGKAFQYGFSLISDTDQFDNSDASSDDITNSLVVAYCACTPTIIDNVRVLLIKVAALSGSNLEPLTLPQFTSFKAYMNIVKDAGVSLQFYNQSADLLKVEVNVYYDPMLLGGDGLRTDGLGYPLQEAANGYLLNLGFDGQFINAAFIDALQSSYGVSRRKVDMVSIMRKPIGGVYQSVSSSFIPDAGYCVFDTNGLIINYIADV